MSLPLQLAAPLVVFVVVTVLALALGTGGIGRAATVGELAFAAALVAVIVYAPPRRG